HHNYLHAFPTRRSSDLTAISSEDVSAMESSLSKSLLSLSNYTDKQAESSQEDINALKNVTYGIISTDKPKDFKETLDNIKSRLEDRKSTRLNSSHVSIS